MNIKNKKIFIAVGIILLIIILIAIILFIKYKINWKDFENYSTDIFSIKYPKDWEAKDENSDVGDLKDFKDKNGKNDVRVVCLKKSDMPENQNTLEKLKDNVIEQMKSSQLSIYQDEEPEVENIKQHNMNAIKVNIKYKTLLGNSQMIYAFYEKDGMFYIIICQGEQTDIFNKMIESFKVK